MLTKADKKFLKENFTTKDDLSSMERRQTKRFATKDDLSSMEKRQNTRFATKDDLKDLRSQISDDMDGKLVRQKEEIVTEVGDYISDVIVPMFEDRDKHIDRIEKKIGILPLAS